MQLRMRHGHRIQNLHERKWIVKNRSQATSARVQCSPVMIDVSTQDREITDHIYSGKNEADLTFSSGLLPRVFDHARFWIEKAKSRSSSALMDRCECSRQQQRATMSRHDPECVAVWITMATWMRITFLPNLFNWKLFSNSSSSSYAPNNHVNRAEQTCHYSGGVRFDAG